MLVPLLPLGGAAFRHLLWVKLFFPSPLLSGAVLLVLLFLPLFFGGAAFFPLLLGGVAFLLSLLGGAAWPPPPLGGVSFALSCFFWCCVPPSSSWVVALFPFLPQGRAKGEQHHSKGYDDPSNRWGQFSEHRVAKNTTRKKTHFERQRPMRIAMSGLLGERGVCVCVCVVSDFYRFCLEILVQGGRYGRRAGGFVRVRGVKGTKEKRSGGGLFD